MGLSPTHLTVKLGKKQQVFDLQTIRSFSLDRKKKLIPLIVGGIISSLSLLAMVLQLVSFNLIALLCAGLLLFYYGFTEYVVISISTDNSEASYWLNHKQKATDIRPLAGFVEYFVKFKQFPPIYTSIQPNNLSQYVHRERSPVKNPGALHFQFFPHNSVESVNIKVDPTKLDSPIHFKSSENQIGTSEFKINEGAIISISEAEIS